MENTTWVVTETINFNELANMLNHTRKDLITFYPEELLSYLFICQSRLDVTSFVVCLNLNSKHSNQSALTSVLPSFSCPLPSPLTWRTCSRLLSGPMDFTQWIYGDRLVDLYF